MCILISSVNHSESRHGLKAWQTSKRFNELRFNVEKAFTVHKSEILLINISTVRLNESAMRPY